MRIPFLFPAALALVLSATALACGSADATDPSSDTSDSSEDALSGRSTVKGTWVSQDGTDTGLDLRPNGEFVRDTAKVLNGVFINGARPWQRDTGRFSVSVKNKTITLHVDGGGDEVYAYEYKAAPVLNGMFLPGHEPEASLTLTRQPPPMSHIAFPAQHFKGAQSWCTEDTDCTRELHDGTWNPYFLNGSNPTCDVSTNSCINKGAPVASPEQDPNGN